MINKVICVLFNAVRFLGKPFMSDVMCIDCSSLVQVHKKAVLKIGKNFRTRRNVELHVRENAVLTIGDNVFFNTGCVVTARENIFIGDGTIFGTYVQVFDNDHKRINGIVQDNQYCTSPIKIGANCWIGAGAILLQGTELGDNCVVGGGSVIKGKYEAGAVIIQKRTELDPKKKA